jgi:ATP-dependent DNA helicase RecG
MTENQRMEWKESWRDEYLKWICGFANAEGGVLVIGRNDQGKVIGLTNAAKLMEDIPNKVRDILGIMVDVNLREEAGKRYLEITVEPYPYPVSYKGEYHFRSGSTKQELKGAALDKFLLRKQGRRWDAVPVPGVAVKALDRQVLKRFRERAARSNRLTQDILRETDAVLIEKLHLKDGNYLKRAALLLFHPDPERFVTGAYLKIGRFLTNSDLLYHDEMHGDLFTQVDKTMDLLLTKYLQAMISYEGLQRVETYPVPEEALREALLNAVAHKDYSSGAPIQISVYDDKILFWNSGELHPGWTVETLTRKHSSQPFNPDVANAFFRAGMIESWGRGIEHIIAACNAARVPAPLIRYEATGLWVEFSLPKASQAGAKYDPGGPSNASVKTSVKTSVKILQLLENNPEMTLAEVAGVIGKSVRAIELASSKLVKAGRLRHVGPQKGGRWEVRK